MSFKAMMEEAQREIAEIEDRAMFGERATGSHAGCNNSTNECMHPDCIAKNAAGR